VLGACQLVGWALRPLRLTQVIAEIVVGLALGPSLLGALAPAAEEWLFPHAVAIGDQIGTHTSMVVINTLGQLGLAVYLFVMGVDVDVDIVSRNIKKASGLSIVSLVLPLVVGGTMGLLLLRDDRLFGATTTPVQAALFMGTAMATTAFPVLARILYDLGINRMQTGVLAITAASVNDVAAWCLLAVILASTLHSPALVGVAVGGVALFTLIMIAVGRRLVRRIEGVWRASGTWSRGLPLVFLLIFASAWTTDRIGIHPFFGAFVAGLIFPRGEFNAELKKGVEAFSVTLLPFFFVYSGRNTQLGLLAEPRSLLLGLSIIAVATISKAGGGILGARLTGSSWPECLTLGILMNTRGLVELIVIDVGLEKGLISPTLFSALVLMTLVTTMSSTPLIHALDRAMRKAGSRSVATQLWATEVAATSAFPDELR